MARQAKAAKATVVEPDEYSFTGDSGPPIDKPPIDNDRLERDCEEIDADVDYEPDFAPEGEGREESDGKPLENLPPLVTPEQLKILHEGSKKLLTPLTYMNIDKHNNFVVGSDNKNATGSKLLAIPDWAIVQRTLWVGGKGVQTVSHRWIEHGSAPPKRPSTFTDRSKWKSYNKDGKDFDPWGSISHVLPFEQGSGGIVSLQVNFASHKSAVAKLIEAFDGFSRPIVELIVEADPDAMEAGAKRPVFKIIGRNSKGKDFDFLRDLLLKNDPEYPEPKPQDFSDLL